MSQRRKSPKFSRTPVFLPTATSLLPTKDWNVGRYYSKSYSYSNQLLSYTEWLAPLQPFLGSKYRPKEAKLPGVSTEKYFSKASCFALVTTTLIHVTGGPFHQHFMDASPSTHLKAAYLLHTPRRPTLYAAEPKFPPRLRCRLSYCPQRKFNTSTSSHSDSKNATSSEHSENAAT